MIEHEEPVSAAPVVQSGQYACLLWVAVVSLLILSAMLLAAWLVPDGSVLFQEGGVVETASVVIWGLSFLMSAWTAIKARTAADRWPAVWFGMVSLLAGLRELDAETLLNPESLGMLGIRYKLGWWIDGAVPVWVKLGWGVVFLALAFVLVYPVWTSRREFVRNLTNRDSRLLILGASICFLGLGFVFDDLMRGSTLVAFGVRQWLEETLEWIGAIWFLVVVILHMRPMHRAAAAQVPGRESAPKPDSTGPA